MSGSLRETIKAKQRSASKSVRELWQNSAASYGPFYGLYRGKVVNNIDPLFLNRLLVEVPTLPCSISSFAMPASPYGGELVGLVTTPPIGANVWVKFENGDPSTPVWVGCFWTEGMKPLLAELPTQQVFSTGSFKAMVNDIPDVAECMATFIPPGFNLPTTAIVTSEGANLTVGDIELSITPEEVSLIAPPTKFTMTNAGIMMTAPGFVSITDTTTTVKGATSVVGAVEIKGEVTQAGAVQIQGAVSQTGAFSVEGATTMTGAVQATGNVNVTGAMEITGDAEIAGGAQVEGNLNIDGAIEGAGDVAVVGAIEAAGEMAMAGAIEVAGAVVSTAMSPGGLNTL